MASPEEEIMSTQPNRMPQALGDIPAISMNGGVALAPPLGPQLVPLPPNLHWSIVLIIFLFGGQLLIPFWALVQANWARKLGREKKPSLLVAMLPAGFLVAFVIAVLYPDLAWLGALLSFAGLIAYLIGLFSIKLAMEEYYNSTEDIGLRMSGAMTFFFHVIYIQYHINRLARRKETIVLT
jgi:hypothetical protein